MRIKTIKRRELKYLLPWEQYQEVVEHLGRLPDTGRT